MNILSFTNYYINNYINNTYVYWFFPNMQVDIHASYKGIQYHTFSGKTLLLNNAPVSLWVKNTVFFHVMAAVSNWNVLLMLATVLSGS